MISLFKKILFFFKFEFRSLLLWSPAFFIFVAGHSVFAQTLTVPATSSTGSFSITWSGGTLPTMIDEYQNSTWTNIGSGNQTGTLAVTKTTNGTYTYRLRTCVTGQSGLSCTTPSNSKSIVVTLSGNSECTHSTGNTTSYCYDEIGRVKSVRHPNGVIDSYSYDAADNRTQKISN